jgi:tRNA-binding protein
MSLLLLELKVFLQARFPSFKLKIGSGPPGLLKSSAQMTKMCAKDSLIGKQVAAVTNPSPRQIANLIWERHVLGFVQDEQVVALLQPERTVPNKKR